MSILVTALSLLAVIVAVAAYPTKDDDSFYYGRLHDLSNFNKETRNLDGIGGGNLLRDLDLLRNRADLLSRASRDQGENDKKQGMAYHYMDPLLGNTIGLAKRFRPYETLRFGNIPNKREWDEIDRSSFGSFAKKNFDEIDRSGFGSFVKKNFDEIDRSGFGSFVKRSVPQSAPEVPQN